jgi:licheninase
VSPSATGSGPVWSQVWADDFNAFPSSTDWGIYDSVGHDGQGVRSPSAFSAANGILTITGNTSGTTGGMSRRNQQRYGKWEARVKTAGCTCYHPVLILWGTPGSWPQAGEVDYLESSHRTTNTMFVHYGADNSQVSGSIAVDMTQWHTYTVEWTPNYMAGYVDGQRFFYSTDKTIQPPSMVQATIQLDWFPGEVSTSNRTGATMDVDWIRQYKYVAG